jgi:hypothetical protein
MKGRAQIKKRVGRMQQHVLQKKKSSMPNNITKTYKTPLRKCAYCAKRLCVSSQAKNKPVGVVVVGCEYVTHAMTVSARCCSKKCRKVHRVNFVWKGKDKINVLTYNQIKKAGVYFVTNNFAFSVPFLELSLLRLFRAKVAPGQEAAVQELWHAKNEHLMGQTSLRDNLLHAMEGLALARRTPDKVVMFNLNFPASHFKGVRSNLLFPPHTDVSVVAFDGHFGIHRKLETGVDPPRSVALRGRPPNRRKVMKRTGKATKVCMKISKTVGGANKKHMKVVKKVEHGRRGRPSHYHDDERTCSCADKSKARRELPNHTAGWQFVVDPVSRLCLGAKEHLQNECVADKLDIVRDVLKMPRVNADGAIHDDMCTFEPHARADASGAFASIEHYVIGKLHLPNHKCKKNKWTRKQEKRFLNVPSEYAESFNAWIRPFNFFVNGLRPSSHLFWMKEIIMFYNENRHVVVKEYMTRRSTAVSRAKGKRR